MEAHDLEVVILAAGQGKRMRSRLPKVLHPLGGRALLRHCLDTAIALTPRAVHVVYGHGGEAVRAAFSDVPVQWSEQPAPRGTGDAVACALPRLQGSSRVLVLYGDVPLLRPATLRTFLEAVPPGDPGVMTVTLSDPTGYGRILRDAYGMIAAIREERDASTAERQIREVNTGIMVLPAARLASWLSCLAPDNAQGECYLTDVVALARGEGMAVHAVRIDDPWEAAGVNDRAQLAALEREYQRRQADRLLTAGVGLADPSRLDVRGDVEAAPDCWIEPNVILVGRVRLGAGTHVGAGSILKDVETGEGVEILPYSLIEGAVIGDGARIGPFARVRPHTEVGPGAHVGNFVEVKASRIGRGSKANHLSYLGDSEVGEGVNIGAGTITCNYDGANKHRTIIGDRAFIGSDTQLVAPVRIGRNATIGAGSTITRDVPEGGLTLSRVPQKHLPLWQRPRKGDRGEGGAG